MPIDQFRYDVLVQEALRGMVRGVLAEVAKTKMLPGEHHFFITFDTTADGVRLSDRMRAQYPEEMTIVLQHQFWDLKVTDDTFEVGLSFGGVAEKLVVPIVAIKAFADPSVQFTLQFETLVATADDTDGAAEAAAEIETGKQPEGRQRPADAPASLPQADKAGAEVVRLDRFRKK
jgi:hypothetical protein